MKTISSMATAAAAVILAGFAAQAQEKYPTRAIEVIVPFVAGGSTDLGGRVIAQALEAKWGVPVRLINKPGGNTVPAVNDVMNAKPDGYTVLADGPPQSSMLDTAVKTLPFKVTDRTFINVAAYTPMMFVAHVDSPLVTLKDAMDLAKKNPATFTWTSLGGAGAQDMANRQFFKAIGVDVTKTRPIQLKGGAEAITLTAGGHVVMGVGSYSSIAAPLEAKKLKVLAVAAPERWPNLPTTPTAAELGFPSIEVLHWVGFSGPPGMKPEVVAAWDKALAEIAADPAVAAGLLKVGLKPLYENAAGMRARVTKERAETQELWSR